MNLSHTPSRTRLTTLGASVAAVLLAVSLSACGGDDIESLSCGELKDMSGQEYIDAVKDAAEEDGSEAAKQAADSLTALEDLPDEQLDQAVQTGISSLCDGQDDDFEPFKS